MPPMRKRPLAQAHAQASGSKRAKASEAEEEERDSGSQLDSSESGGEDSFPENSDEDNEQQDSDDDSDDEDDDEDAKEIRVEFEFFDPEDKDFLGLKTLLTNYLNGEQFDSSGLIDAIIAEGDVGSVVKTDEDDDPIAVMAVLNTTQYKDSPFMKQIQEFLTLKCPSSAADAKQGLTKALSSSGTGLIVNERLLNAPPQLGPPLMQFLMEGIEERAEQGDDDAKYYQFKRYLLATRVYLERNSTGTSNSHKENAGVSSSGSQSPLLVFVRPEDEFLHQQCAWSFTFPVEGRPVSKDGLLAHRLVMQVDADQVPAARAELDKVVGNMAAGVKSTQGQQGDGQDADDEEEEEAAAGPPKGKAKGSKASKGGAQDVAKMAEEMFAAAAAAGAGRGAGQGGGKKKKGKAGKKKGHSVKVTTL